MFFTTQLPFSGQEEKAFLCENSISVLPVEAYEATCRSPSGKSPHSRARNNDLIGSCTQELILCSSTVFPNSPSSMKAFLVAAPLGPTVPACLPAPPPAH